MVFVGYSQHWKAYRLRNPASNKIFESMDAKFDQIPGKFDPLPFLQLSLHTTIVPKILKSHLV